MGEDDSPATATEANDQLTLSEEPDLPDDEPTIELASADPVEED